MYTLAQALCHYNKRNWSMRAAAQLRTLMSEEARQKAYSAAALFESQGKPSSGFRIHFWILRMVRIWEARSSKVAEWGRQDAMVHAAMNDEAALVNCVDEEKVRSAA